MDNFQKYLENSLALNQDLFAQNSATWTPIDTLYIGGGTPSLWGEKGIAYLVNLLDRHGINFSDEYEFTIELNPGSWNKVDLKGIKDLGVNRVSVGVQSLSAKTLKALDRIHNVDDVYKTLDCLADLDFNFSVDFMLGLPREKSCERDISNEVNEILSFNPSHMSAYILTVNKNYIHYNSLPDENYISDEYLTLSSLMTGHGFDHYEVSNFAKPNSQSKHNLKYWRGESVAALGPSATGFLKCTKDSGIRYKWKTLEAPDFSIEDVSINEYKLERFFLNLRISEGINLIDYVSEKKIDEVKSFVDVLNVQGHLSSSSLEKFSLSPSGFLCADSITTRLMSYI